MEKAQRAKRVQQEAEQAEQAKRNEQAAAEQAERDYERLISSKQANLPAEAPSDSPDAVTIMVRLPNGIRASRRCQPDPQNMICWLQQLAPRSHASRWRILRRRSKAFNNAGHM